MTRILATLAVFAGVTNAFDLAGLGAVGGKIAGFATPFLPPELRGITGAAANAAMAAAMKKIGVVNFVTDGTDYPYICLCPTPGQIAALKKLGSTVAPDKCAEDQTMGCRPPQVDMTNAPLPQLNVPKSGLR